VVAPLTLADLVAPDEVGHFLSRTYGREYGRWPGDPGRFAGLLPWPALNAILRQHRLAHPRLRLARDGRPIPVESYTEQTTSRRGVTVPKLKSGEFSKHLRAGATLVLDSVEELYDPVGELAASLEHTLREHVQVNAYGSWGTTHGFDVHWDDHDVFVLQVSGRKRWGVYGLSRPAPLYRDAEPNTERPPAPVSEFVLEAGDVLYLPRGWWHVASAMAEPSLHLTFGINPATGIDLVTWLADRLRADERFRADLPRFGSGEERRAVAAELGRAVAAAWNDDLVDQFLAERDAAAGAGTRLSLPFAATPAVLPDDDAAEVRLLAPRATLLRPGDTKESPGGTVELRAAGQRYVFAAVAAPLLDALLDGAPHTIGELAGLAAPAGRDDVRALLAELADRGLLALD
jgi:hypothetical protein